MFKFNHLPGLRALTAPLAVMAACGLAPLAVQAQGVQFLGPIPPFDVGGSTGVAPGPLYEVRVANPRSNGDFGTYDAVVFSKVDTNVVFGTRPAVKTSQLHWFTSTLAANIDLFAVQSGDVFSEQRVASDTFTSMLAGVDIAEPLSFSPALGSFYLGVRVAVPPEMSSFWQGSMGWLKFQSRPGSPGNRLVLVDSFISYGASGVVIGQVPEGGALAMALAGLGVMGVTRLLATSRKRTRA